MNMVINIGMRENLQVALEYKRWDKFCKVIKNDKITCEKSKYAVSYHFSQVGKMVDIGSGAKRKQVDYIEIKIFFKCHKTTLFLGFVFYYIKLKKERVYE